MILRNSVRLSVIFIGCPGQAVPVTIQVELDAPKLLLVQKMCLERNESTVKFKVLVL